MQSMNRPITTCALFFLMLPPPPRSTLFPYTTLFRSLVDLAEKQEVPRVAIHALLDGRDTMPTSGLEYMRETVVDRKSTRLNSSHGYISYAVFCLKKKKI